MNAERRSQNEVVSAADAEIESRDVKEHRSGEADRVDAIEHAAVSLDQRAVILHAAVALDRRHGHSAGEPHHAGQKRHPGRAPRLERRGPPRARRQERRARGAAEKTFPRLARADGRGDRPCGRPFCSRGIARRR